MRVWSLIIGLWVGNLCWHVVQRMDAIEKPWERDVGVNIRGIVACVVLTVILLLIDFFIKRRKALKTNN